MNKNKNALFVIVAIAVIVLVGWYSFRMNTSLKPAKSAANEPITGMIFNGKNVIYPNNVLPPLIAEDIPNIMAKQILENKNINTHYLISTGNSTTTQSTRSFVATGTVAANADIYKKYLSTHNWQIESKELDEGIILKGRKGDDFLTFIISDIATDKYPTIVRVVAQKTSK